MCGFKLFKKFYVLYVSVNSVNFLCPPSSGFQNDLYCHQTIKATKLFQYSDIIYSIMYCSSQHSIFIVILLTM